MKFFRTHIIRFTGTLTLLAGIALYFLQPVDKQGQHENFAIWLQSHLKAQSNSDVSNKISKLTFSDEKFDAVLKKASILVQSHLQDFELPVNKHDADEQEVFQLLLTEWNAFQDFAKGMGKAAIIKNAKPYSVLPTDALAFSGKFSSQLQNPALRVDDNPFYESFPLQDYHTSPFKSGTAIGAP